MKTAVIIPYVNEWPQILFTIRTIAEELRGKADFEIIAVDNWHEDVTRQLPQAQPDRGHEHRGKNGEMAPSHIFQMAQQQPWLKYLRYTEKLSHWNAKNFAVANTDAELLLFVDAHVIPARKSLSRMISHYEHHGERLNGTLHLPLTYHLLEAKKLIYSLRWYAPEHEMHYTFCAAKTDRGGVYEVPCMSTCGMLMHRSIFDKVGGWPQELGIYGGGENFMNFTLAAMGMKKHIFGHRPLYHHGDERGYRWNFVDYERNRMIATFLFGGEEFASKYAETRHVRARGGGPRAFRKLLDSILPIDSIQKQRSLIESRTSVDLKEWGAKWMEVCKNDAR
jgi:hypothetical protein